VWERMDDHFLPPPAAVLPFDPEKRHEVHPSIYRLESNIEYGNGGMFLPSSCIGAPKPSTLNLDPHHLALNPYP